MTIPLVAAVAWTLVVFGAGAAFAYAATRLPHGGEESPSLSADPAESRIPLVVFIGNSSLTGQQLTVAGDHPLIDSVWVKDAFSLEIGSIPPKSVLLVDGNWLEVLPARDGDRLREEIRSAWRTLDGASLVIAGGKDPSGTLQQLTEAPGRTVSMSDGAILYAGIREEAGTGVSTLEIPGQADGRQEVRDAFLAVLRWAGGGTVHD